MLVERKPVAINGTDFTAYFTDTGYTVNYIKRTGSNGGMMQDGTITEDLIAIKAVVVLPPVPLTEAQLSTLLSAVWADGYPLLDYYDPMAGALKSVQTVATVSKSKYRGQGADANKYWTGTVITLTER